MNLAVEYAKVRRQFDQPIGSFQAVQHLCVDMYEAVELARSGVIHALWAADAAEPAERHRAALRAKAFAGRLASVGDTAIQVFGGIGFTWEHDAHLYLKRLLGWSAFLGGTRPVSRGGRRATRQRSRTKGVAMSQVLSGVRVVELASWTYVPSAGAALADWGADVIKVEDVKAGDPGRALVIGGFTRQNARADVDFILEIGNRGKRSVAIDIKSDTGREYFGRLLATADVFLTNWLPGALERARLTVEDIRSFNPNIIIARGTGTGVRGPDRDKGGFDAATYLSRGGVSYTMTPFGTETPAVQGPGFGDLQGGITLAGGVCAALFHRERTGEPSVVDSSLLAQAMWTIAPSISVADLFGIDGIPGAPPGLGDQPAGQPLQDARRQVDPDGLPAARSLLGRLLRADRPARARHRRTLRAVEQSDRQRRRGVQARRREASPVEDLEHWRKALADEPGVWAALATPKETLNDPQVEPNGYTIPNRRRPRASSTRSSPHQCNSTKRRRRPRALPNMDSTPRRSCWSSTSTGTTSRRPRTAARFSEREERQ